MSWIRLGDNGLTRFIYEMTEPVLGFFRRIIPVSPGMPLDFSPILAFIALQIVENLVLRMVIGL